MIQLPSQGRRESFQKEQIREAEILDSDLFALRGEIEEKLEQARETREAAQSSIDHVRALLNIAGELAEEQGVSIPLAQASALTLSYRDGDPRKGMRAVEEMVEVLRDHLHKSPDLVIEPIVHAVEVFDAVRAHEQGLGGRRGIEAAVKQNISEKFKTGGRPTFGYLLSDIQRLSIYDISSSLASIIQEAVGNGKTLSEAISQYRQAIQDARDRPLYLSSSAEVLDREQKRVERFLASQTETIRADDAKRFVEECRTYVAPIEGVELRQAA